MGLPRRKVQPLLLFLPWKDLGKRLNHSWLLWSLSPRTNPLPNLPLTGVSKGIPKKYHVRFLWLVYIFHHASSGKSKNDKVLSLFFPYSFQRCWPLTPPPHLHWFCNYPIPYSTLLFSILLKTKQDLLKALRNLISNCWLLFRIFPFEFSPMASHFFALFKQGKVVIINRSIYKLWLYFLT